MRLIEIDDEDFGYELQMTASDDYNAVMEQYYVDLGHGNFDVEEDFTWEVRNWTWENCGPRASFFPRAYAVRFTSLADATHFKLRWS